MTTFARLTLPFIEELRTLPPCCRLLYEWLLERYPAGRTQEVFLEEFADRLKYNVRHVRRSLKKLIDHRLVEPIHRYSADVFKLIVHDDRTLSLQGNSEASSESSVLAENSAKSVEKDPVSSIKKSTSSASNADSFVTSNKEEFRDYKDTHPLHPVLNEPRSRSVGPKDPVLGTNSHTSPSSISSKDASILEEIQTTLQKPLNKNILAVIAEYPITRALDALDAFREAIARGHHIRNPLGWFRTAIEKGYKPQTVSVSEVEQSLPVSSDTSHVSTSSSSIPEGFNEWFDLAKQAGVALASGDRNGELYIYGSNTAEPYEQMCQTWPLAKLRELLTKSTLPLPALPVMQPNCPVPTQEEKENPIMRAIALARLQGKYAYEGTRRDAIAQAKFWEFMVTPTGIVETIGGTS